MEESDQGSQASEDRSQKTAAALRALREGLGTKLDSHRRRISDMESDLTARVLQIADEMAVDQAAENQAGLLLRDDQYRKLKEALSERDATIARLQRQLSDTELHHLRASAELVDSRTSVESKGDHPCETCSGLRSELATAQESAAAAGGKIAELEGRIAEFEAVAAGSPGDPEAMHAVEATQLRNELAEQRQQIEASAERELELELRVESLTQELAQARAAEQKLQAQHTADNAAYIKSQLMATQGQQLLSQRTAELATATEQIESQLKQIETLTEELAATAEREAQASSHAAELVTQLESLTGELETARQIESDLRNQCSTDAAAVGESQSAVTELQQRLDELASQLAAASERETDANARVEQLLGQVEGLTRDLAAAREAETELRNQQTADDTTLSELQRSSEEAQQALREELATLTATHDALRQELEATRAELAARGESASDEIAWLQKERQAAQQSHDQLATEFGELLKQQQAEREALSEFKAKAEQSSLQLQQAEERIKELTAASEDELEQTRRKFELALTDAQKLKRENTQLQEELARRPETAENESPELVSLRVERDALAARIAELEASPIQAIDEDSEQRFADLQRRFELAVEDLRHLKQENASLTEKLASASPSAQQTPAAGQAMDWQAQKARLLAALESEDADDQSAERREELVTIEGTLQITDRVVAEKDLEIARLRDQLNERPVEGVEKEVEANILDTDELIAAERAKLAALQSEWHEKLRAAELEISVQRAAIARKEAEIEQKLQAVEAAQNDPAVGADGKPRRRWLSALGLRDDDETDGK